jgi:hypothetical protein
MKGSYHWHEPGVFLEDFLDQLNRFVKEKVMWNILKTIGVLLFLCIAWPIYAAGCNYNGGEMKEKTCGGTSDLWGKLRSEGFTSADIPHGATIDGIEICGNYKGLTIITYYKMNGEPFIVTEPLK